MLVPLCCTSEAVRHKEFRMLLKGFSSKTLALRLKELEKGGILRRQAYNEIPPRVEYQLTPYQLGRQADTYSQNLMLLQILFGILIIGILLLVLYFVARILRPISALTQASCM